MIRSEGLRGAYSEDSSDTESTASDRTAFSGPLASGGGGLINKKHSSKKSAGFNIPPETTINSGFTDDSSSFVEITLDICDDSVAVHSVQGANEDPELTLLAKTALEGNNSSSLRSSLFRNTSSKIRQVSQELKLFASRRSSTARRFDRTKSAAAHALKGLKFITAKTGNGWPAVEKRFQELTASTHGLLPCSLFGECIGEYRCWLLTYSSSFCDCLLTDHYICI